MSTIKVDNLQTTGGAGLYPARAWVTFTMDGTPRILADAGVSSLADLGTGKPQFNLSTALAAANGLPFNTGALWHDAGGPTGTTREYPIQTGGRISVTSAWRCFCGSEGSGYIDWDLGYSGLIR